MAPQQHIDRSSYYFLECFLLSTVKLVDTQFCYTKYNILNLW